MTQETIAAILNLIQAMLPTLEAGAVALYSDIKQLTNDAKNAGAATPEQVAQAEQLDAASDAALDAAHAAYDALKAKQGA